jgi:hypothetical protein
MSKREYPKSLKEIKKGDRFVLKLNTSKAFYDNNWVQHTIEPFDSIKCEGEGSSIDVSLYKISATKLIYGEVTVDGYLLDASQWDFFPAPEETAERGFPKRRKDIRKGDRFVRKLDAPFESTFENYSGVTTSVMPGNIIICIAEGDDPKISLIKGASVWKGGLVTDTYLTADLWDFIPNTAQQPESAQAVSAQIYLDSTETVRQTAGQLHDAVEAAEQYSQAVSKVDPALFDEIKEQRRAIDYCKMQLLGQPVGTVLDWAARNHK